MNANAFKKSFREQLKEKKMKIKISEKNVSTIITDQHGDYCNAKYRIAQNGLTNSHWKWAGSSDEVLLKTVEYWEGLASIEERPFISFYHSQVEKVMTLLEPLGYKKLSDFISQSDIDALKINELKRFNRSKEFVKELHPGFFKKLAMVDRKIESFLKKMKEKDPTFEAERFSNQECLNSIPFYYKGYRETLYFSFREDQFVLENNDKQPICFFDETTDLDVLFGEKLNALEKKMRLKNIYSPPKKHFYTYVRELSLRENDEATKTIYEILMQRYSPEEVELFASQNKRCRFEQLDIGALFKFLDVYFLYNFKHIPVLNDVYYFDNEEDLVENLKIISEKELSHIREQRNKELESLKKTLQEL